MPLPKPNQEEKRNDFNSRCMGNSNMNKEFPNAPQRLAVCRSLWDKSKVDKLTSDMKSLDNKE